MPRKIIQIDESLCDGCGECILSCAEGALYLENGKAKLAADRLCDGLGACLGECPRGALKVIEREAEAFDEIAVHAHLKTAGHPANRGFPAAPPVLLHGGGCPGSRSIDLGAPSDATPAAPPRRRLALVSDAPANAAASSDVAHANGSRLGQWPVQLRLVSPAAPYFQGADLLVAADCVPFAYARFHDDLLAGKALVVGCPKLDDVRAYAEKLGRILASNEIRSVTVVRMEVPCCGGISAAARHGLAASGKDLPFRDVVVGVDGTIRG